jgi:hypothetical protein
VFPRERVNIFLLSPVDVLWKAVLVNERLNVGDK